LADNAPALAATLELTPVDHVVFGTDWPYLALPDGDDPAPALQALGAGRAGVDGVHAGSLLRGT
jgi:predicted TIM-barrel fold metal-dependent hydrolase